VAKNPYQPGVGTPPRYLAGREPEINRFNHFVEDFPEKRRNIRISGLRGVGKTVLLKRFERDARAKPHNWVVIRRDLGPRVREEADFAIAVQEWLQLALEELSTSAKVKRRVGQALEAIGEISLEVPGGLTVTVGGQTTKRQSVLEERLRKAFIEVGQAAAAAERGVAFLFDEAHTVYDQPKRRQYPLGALLGAVVAAQDQDDPPLPLMLVMCGLPPIVSNLQAARSHSERLFKAEEIANLPLEPDTADRDSEAVLALTKPTINTGISFAPQVAEQIARDLDGYPYFIQWYGEQLWDSARDAGLTLIDSTLYAANKRAIQRELDREFYEMRYEDLQPGDQMSLRVAGSLGGEEFRVGELNAAIETRKPNANAQSLNRLVEANAIYRRSYGLYAYTAPLFGDFLRRAHPLEKDDG
jgi:AAA ATPase domain